MSCILTPGHGILFMVNLRYINRNASTTSTNINYNINNFYKLRIGLCIL